MNRRLKMFSFLPRWLRLREIVTPVLFALFPILVLYGQNAAKLPVQALVPPVLVVAGVALGLFAVLWVFVRDAARASLLASMVLIGLWILWKPVFDARASFFDWVPEWLLIAIYMVAIVAGCVAVQRRLTNTPTLTSAAFLTAVAILCWPSFQIARQVMEEAGGTGGEAPAIALPGGMGEVAEKPNVVLLILDAYGRADQLEKIYGFDNGDFLDGLRARGFIVAERSTSNYRTTALSLASFFNMDYLDEMGIDMDRSAELRRANAATTVSSLFQSMGYTRIGFPTGYLTIDDESNFDYVIRSPALWGVLSEFEAALVDGSPLGAIARLAGFYPAQDAWRANILNTLENVHRPLLSSSDRPVFVRAHVVCPHFPHVFRADGGFVPATEVFSLQGSADWGEEYVRRMVEQTRGLNVHVMDAIDRILESSPEPPVFLLISDHGARADPQNPKRRQFENLCALYLPGPGASLTAADVDTLSLVNLFRFVFNTYFNADFPLLDTVHVEGDGPFIWTRRSRD